MSVIKAIGEFIQNQVLGMKWLNALIGDLLSSLGLDVTGRIGGSVQFFIYDVVKITILLCFLIFLISYIQSFSIIVPPTTATIRPTMTYTMAIFHPKILIRSTSEPRSDCCSCRWYDYRKTPYG